MILYSPRIWGNFMRAQREKRGWNMAQMAQAIGCTLMWISLQERGRLPHAHWVKQAAAALGEDPAEWLRVYLAAVADAVQVPPDAVFDHDEPNPLPTEFQTVLNRILADPRKYRKALKVLEVIAE